MSAVGLDLSLTHTGIAYADGTVASLRTELRGMHRLDQIRMAVSLALIDSPTVVAIEGYSYGAKGNSLLNLAELGGIIRHLCYTSGTDWLDVPPAVLKRYATGTGNATKLDMVIGARDRLGYTGTDDNEADALWLRALALEVLGTPTVRLPAKHLAATRNVIRHQARINY